MDEIQLQPTVTPISSASPVVPTSKPKSHAVLWIATGAVILTIGIGIGLVLGKYSPKQIISYEECMKAKGSRVQESNPPTCVTANGLSFKGPVSSPTLTPDPTINWKTYRDTKNQFTFLYPPNLQMIADLKSIPPNSIIVRVESVDINTAIKQNEFDITQLRDVPIPGRSGEAFKRGSFERNTNGLIAFFPLNRSQTLILTEYFDAPISDANINSQFDQILSTFKFGDQATPGPTCKPRPACLDATPRCMIPETSDMCSPNQKL